MDKKLYEATVTNLGTGMSIFFKIEWADWARTYKMTYVDANNEVRISREDDLKRALETADQVIKRFIDLQ